MPVNTKLVYLPVPRFLQEGCLDVSAGKEQICAISSLAAVVCWTYNAETKYNGKFGYELQ